MSCKLCSFSYIPSLDSSLCEEALTIIESLHYYFLKFNKTNVEAVKQNVLYHTLLNYDSNNGRLEPYIKKLARTMGKTSIKPKEVSSENLDLTFSSGDDSIVFENLLDNCMDRVQNLAISNVHYFLRWCYCMFDVKDRDNSYFPKEFKNMCLSLSQQSTNFVPYCKYVYDKYGQAMRDFENLIDVNSNWKEADCNAIISQTSKRVYFVDACKHRLDEYNGSFFDLDNLNCGVVGSLQDKRIIRIKYTDVWDMMCNLIEEQDIAVKLTIGNYYVIRTLGGSLMLPNSDLNSAFRLCLDEITTNLLNFTLGRYMGRGLNYMYFLVSSVQDIPICSAMGVEFSFQVEDVTLRFIRYN